MTSDATEPGESEQSPEEEYRIEGEFENWVHCGECGSDNVIVTNPEYYESRFDCEDCGAVMKMGW